MSGDLIIQTDEPMKLILQVNDRKLVMGIACPVGIGEANAGANAGAGSRVFRDVVGGALIFRTLRGIGGVNISENGDEIEFQTHVSALVDPTPADDSYVVGTLWTNTALGQSFILRDNTPASAIWDSFAGPVWNKDTILSAAGQVTFILSQAPTDPDSVEVDVNGVTYEDVADYTISGVTITWLNTAFVMAIGDRMVIRYR